MSTYVGIVVNTATMMIARIVVPDTDAGLANEVINPGERMIPFSKVIYQSLGNRDDIAAYLGLVG